MDEYIITEQQLLDLIDGKYSTAESRIIKDAINSSTELKTHYKELLHMHSTMLKYNIVKTPIGFLESVMTGLESRKLSIDDLFDSINKLGLKLLLVVLTLTMATIYFVTIDSVNLNFVQLLSTTTELNPYNVDITPISKLFNDKLILNGFLFICTVCSLILFDRVVLRPWFDSRKTIV